MVSRHFQHNGLLTSNLGGLLFWERPRPWALPYIECAILELVGFLFNVHLFIFVRFLVCITCRAKWMFVSTVSRFGFAHCEWIPKQLQIVRSHSNLVTSSILKLRMDVVSWEERIP
jgi:hypothetical protein